MTLAFRLECEVHQLMMVVYVNAVCKFLLGGLSSLSSLTSSPSSSPSPSSLTSLLYTWPLPVLANRIHNYCILHVLGIPREYLYQTNWRALHWKLAMALTGPVNGSSGEVSWYDSKHHLTAMQCDAIAPPHLKNAMHGSNATNSCNTIKFKFCSLCIFSGIVDCTWFLLHWGIT